MRRVRLTAVGWDQPLAVEHCADPPAPAGDQVVVQVEACGVCYRDCIDRDGRFAFVRLPITPGHEAVGRVVAVGAAVSEWRVGDRVATMHRDFCGSCGACRRGDSSLCRSAAAVLGLLVDGGYATHLSAPSRCLYRAADLPGPAAAILHCTFGTAYRGVRRFGRLRAGQRVLVTGANGGVGSAAVQVAARLGAEVVAVVRDEAAVEFVRGCGASAVLVDPGDRFHKRIGQPVDVAIDCVGQPTFNAAVRSVAIGGRVVVVGNVVPKPVQLNLGYLITRGIELCGSSGATRDDMADVVALHCAHPFRFDTTVISLDNAETAQRQVRAGQLRGRLVLVP
jgi:acryloyl-coenzyme A reductase